MKSQKSEEMSNEALLKHKRITELAMGMLAGALSALLVMVILLASRKGLDATKHGAGGNSVCVDAHTVSELEQFKSNKEKT